ncbi:putative zinc knuckle domain-containing protein [Colletotrichum sublineola]|uniref:Putative zinc knuckle domain-containing protein n=1 Tax=Colletotrichum sublineola TaxID=1173701 RepID=A0A066X1A0_COLSU|nr:putative zinc knuckle domain-containing protein [Colletotrichum sublineola]
MDASKPTEAASALSSRENDIQQALKKRPLEDVEQGDIELSGSPQSHQAESPEPEAKRAKTEVLDQQHAQNDTKDLESAEEGELEEDGEVQSSESESEEMAGTRSGGSRASRAPSKASVVSEESDAGFKRTTRSMSAAADGPAHVGWNQGITSQIRTSLGRSKAETAPPPAKEVAISDEVTSELVPAAESEPVKSAQPAKKEGKLTRKEQQQQRAEAATLEKQKAQEQQKNPFVYAPGLTFFQPNKKTILQPKGNNLGKAVWKSKFKSWCQSFVSRNTEQSSLLTADIVIAALQDYITTRAHWSKKKYSTAAIAETRKPETKNEIAVNLATILKDDSFLPGSEESPMVIDDDDEADNSVQEISRPAGDNASAVPETQGEHDSIAEDPDQSYKDDTGASKEVEQTEPGPPVMTEDEDLAQQRKYFPGLPESVEICVYCASVGHNSTACPKTACKFCQQPNHFSWNCPTRERCTKCRQLGHGKARCTEKLVHLDEEGMECAICGAQDHLEDECEVLWRSYKPQDGLVKKVKVFPAFCASCGTEGHYSSDCALRGDRPRNHTWSLKNRSLYVDKNAVEGPISDFASQPQNPKFPLQIKGSAAKRNHIFYPDSDGSEEGEFIGQRVKPRAPLGNIQLSTNLQINMGNFGAPPQTQQNGRGQQRGGWSTQPPLPPGPPPAGPPPGSYSRMSRSFNNQSRPPPPNSSGGPGSGLPPKPPAPQSQQHGYRNAGPSSRPNPPKKQRTRDQSGSTHTGSSQQQQNGGGPAPRRRGKARRGGKQG